jgi:hypothetical protein
VETSTCEAEYMVLALAMKQWIWLTNALDELDMQVTNVAMIYDDKATIKLGDNH